MADKCIRAYVSGRVQGVFFRESTRRQAVQIDISGYAANLADGRVEVVACGEPVQIEKLLGWLHRGPEYASVSKVEVETLAPQHITGFSTR